MADGIANRFDSVEYDGVDERLLAAVLSHPSSALLSRAGVRPGGGLAVTVGGTPEAATIAPGGGIITDAAGGGSFPFVIPAAVAINLATRPAGGTSRIDEVVAIIKNVDARPADGTREVDLAVITGTAGASPVAPTIPTGQLRLAQLQVPAVAAVTASLPPPRIAAAGGIIPVANQTERDAISPMYDGIIVYREDIDVFEGRVNGAWAPGMGLGPTAYTPTFNGTLGTGGTITGLKSFSGGRWFFEIAATLGGAGLSVSSNLIFGLPAVVGSIYEVGHPIAQAYLLDSNVGSGSRLLGALCVTGAAANTGFLLTAKDTLATATPTVPWTWASGDKILISGSFYPA